MTNPEHIIQPKPGDVLWNKATVIEYTHKADAGNGLLAHGIVICVTPGHTEPYVTWNLAWNPEFPDMQGSWQADRGTYHDKLSAAVTSYNKRCKEK